MGRVDPQNRIMVALKEETGKAAGQKAIPRVRDSLKLDQFENCPLLDRRRGHHGEVL